jgi:hypothetical protein
MRTLQLAPVEGLNVKLKSGRYHSPMRAKEIIVGRSPAVNDSGSKDDTTAFDPPADINLQTVDEYELADQGNIWMGKPVR